MHKNNKKQHIGSILLTNLRHKYFQISDVGMLNTNLDWFELHVALENACLVVSFVIADTELRFCRLLWTELIPHWRRCIVCLIQLPFVLWLTVSRTLGNWPSRLCLCFASVGALFRVISSWSNNLWCRIKQNQRIKSFYSSSCIKTELRSWWYLRL